MNREFSFSVGAPTYMGVFPRSFPHLRVLSKGCIYLLSRARYTSLHVREGAFRGPLTCRRGSFPWSSLAYTGTCSYNCSVSRELVPGSNPREVLRKHKERGPKRFTYTYADIAELANLTEGTIRTNASRGVFDPDDLESVIRYLVPTVLRGIAPVSDGDLQSLGIDLAKWSNRFPKWDLYLCSSTGCDSLLGAPGSCSKHGGLPVIRVTSGLYFEIWVGGSVYVRYHRLVMGEPKGLDVHHIDENKWNNRLENLESLTPQEHRSRHFAKPRAAP